MMEDDSDPYSFDLKSTPKKKKSKKTKEVCEYLFILDVCNILFTPQVASPKVRMSAEERTNQILGIS